MYKRWIDTVNEDLRFLLCNIYGFLELKTKKKYNQDTLQKENKRKTSIRKLPVVQGNYNKILRE